MKKDMNEDTLEKLEYVKSGSYRTKVVGVLAGGEIKIPTVISDETGIRSNHISNVLGELKQAGIAECINEDVRKGRLYRLTPLGEEIAENLD